MSKELKTGIIAILIVVAFFWSYNFLKGHDIFSPSAREFIVEYDNVGGLTEASLVTINGLKVGQVDDINFNQNPNKKGKLIVKFSLENDIQFSKKSIVKIYSPNPLSGSNLAIIPNYEGELAVSLDTLKGEIKAGLLTSIGERLDPLQTKLDRVLIGADTLFQRINNVLDQKTAGSIKSSVKGLEYTITDIRKTLNSVNSLLDSSAVSFNETLKNSSKITEDLAQVTDSLSNVNIGEIVRNAEMTLTSINSILKGIDEGKGTFGKLVNDEALYNNLTAMSKEMEELLREMKLNPKRFVHFSIFGKKAKPYNKEKNENNETSQ